MVNILYLSSSITSPVITSLFEKGRLRGIFIKTLYISLFQNG